MHDRSPPPRKCAADGEIHRIQSLIKRLNRLSNIVSALRFFEAVAKDLKASRQKFSGRVRATMTSDGVRLSSRKMSAAKLKKLQSLMEKRLSLAQGLQAIDGPTSVAFDVEKFEEQFVDPLSRELCYFGIVRDTAAVPRPQSDLQLLVRIAQTQAQWSKYNQRIGTMPGGDYDCLTPIVVGAEVSLLR